LFEHPSGVLVSQKMASVTAAVPWWRRLNFAVILVLALLVVAAIPPVNREIVSFDRTAALSLNRMLGDSPVLDTIVAAFADRYAHVYLLLFTIAAFAVYVAVADSRPDRARRLALLLFLTAAGVLALLADGILDEIVRRPGPTYVMGDELKRPGRLLMSEHIDTTTHESFPSTHGMYFFLLGFILLRLGHRFGAIFILGGIVVPLAKCMVGRHWVTDVYLGALPLAFLLSALAVETRFVGLLGSLQQASLLAFEKLAVRLRQYKYIFDGSLRWETQNVFLLESAIKRYIRSELPVRIGVSKNSATAISMPLDGVRSIVRFVSYGARKVVLRVYPISRRVEAESHRTASEMLHRLGVRTPALLDYCSRPKGYRVIFLVEEFVEGESRSGRDLTSADLHGLAIEMARMHSIHNDRWGPVDAERSDSYFEHLMSRVDRSIAIARAGQHEGFAEDEMKLRQWFLGWRPFFESHPGFTLTHGKMHSKNGLFGTDGRYCFLDFTTLEWTLAERDLVRVYHSICEDLEPAIATFNEAYLAALPASDAKHAGRFMAFFEALHHLTAILNRSKRMRDRPEMTAQMLAVRNRDAWQYVVGIARTVEPGGPYPPLWSPTGAGLVP
jgi:membrane-associated phospholipid phosphatase